MLYLKIIISLRVNIIKYYKQNLCYLCTRKRTTTESFVVSRYTIFTSVLQNFTIISISN